MPYVTRLSRKKKNCSKLCSVDVNVAEDMFINDSEHFFEKWMTSWPDWQKNLSIFAYDIENYKKKKALESQISCEFNLIVKPETTTAKKKTI